MPTASWKQENNHNVNISGATFFYPRHPSSIAPISTHLDLVHHRPVVAHTLVVSATGLVESLHTQTIVWNPYNIEGTEGGHV